MPRDRWAVGVLTALCAGLHAAYGLTRFADFRLSSYDLVIFDQAIRGYAAGGAPISQVKGVHNGFGPGFSILGDHFSPSLALFAPAYWLWPDPRTLLVAQALCFAVGVPLVWIMARRAIGRGTAYALALAYLLAWPLQSATAVGFHEVALAVPLLLLAFERLQARRPGQAALAAAGLLLVKEDLGLVVAAFGVLLAIRGHRRPGALLVVTGLAATVLVPRLVIPAFGGRGDYYAGYYDQVRGLLPDPLAVLHLAVTPDTKWQTLLWLAAAVGFLLLSPSLLVAVPLLAERLLSANPNHWGTGQFYSAYLVPILFVCAIETLQRISEHRRRLASGMAVGVGATALVLCAYFPFGQLVSSRTWRPDDRARAAAAAVAVVPAGVTVEADNRLGPALTGRTTVWLADRTPRGAPWVILDVRSPESFPFADLAERRTRVRELVSSGYRLVLANDYYRVLQRRDRIPAACPGCS